MLDIRLIRQNPDFIKKAAKDKHFVVDVDRLLQLDSEIRPEQQALESLLAERNVLSKKIGKAPVEERDQLKSQVIEIKSKIEKLTASQRVKKEELNQLLLLIPQPAREDVPLGKDDQHNVELRKSGAPRVFDFKPLDHIELGEKLGIIDIPAGVKLAGSRSYILKGQGALLEQALMRYTFDQLLARQFSPVSVPVLVEEPIMEGTGYFPLGRDQAYCVEKDKLALVGTSEVALCGMHMNEMLKSEQLPIRQMAQTQCFRREAGTYGKDTRGLYRVHQFQKIEMVIVAPADKDMTDQLHDELLANAEHIVQSLELPYRVVYVCTGDLGQGQVRKHDIETWMPSRESYGETHSCSSFYDFQARRLNIRYKDAEGKKHFAYTLNNTAVASPRMLLAIMENYQTADGHIEIPKVLRPYMGGAEKI